MQHEGTAYAVNVVSISNRDIAAIVGLPIGAVAIGDNLVVTADPAPDEEEATAELVAVAVRRARLRARLRSGCVRLGPAHVVNIARSHATEAA